MKKIYLIIALSFFLNGYSQFNSNAPWEQQNNSTQKTQEKTFDELVNTFNNYWKDRDYTKKASGYKPFKRWEYRWKNEINEQGYLISPQEINTAFLQKQQSKLNSKSALALPVSNWQPLGPYNNAVSNTRARGRVNVIVADPSNANTLYFGTPAGGIWKSINHGTSWTPLSDNLPQIGVSGIAVDFSNPNTIYIATGDKDAGDTYSIGILKSTDGGVTWNTTGLSFGNTTTRAGDLIMHPSNNQILWCATSVGLYKTTNGGTTWAVAQTGDFAQGSIRLKPLDPTIVYACTKSVFYKSADTGATFVSVALPGITGSGRMVLDVTPANPLYVYVLTSKSADNTFQAIHRSVNSGGAFTKRTAIGTAPNFFGDATYASGTQAWYDLGFAVSSTNADELYVGCLNVRKSSDGGAATANWTMLNDWSVKNPAFTHADIHTLQFINGKLYCGSDGGLFVSIDNGINFSDITTGAQIGQFYKISVAKQNATKIVGGTQDNGGWVYNTANASPWQSYHGGDGMDCAVSPVNNNRIYGFVQNGGTLYGSNDTGATLATGLASPTGETGSWVTALKINSVGDVFSGYSKLFRINECATPVAWVQQNTTNLGTGNIVEIEIAPSNDNIMFVSKGADLWKSTDKGVTFAKVYSAANAITSICVNYSNTNLVYLTTAGTTGLALKSTNGGTAFSSFNTNLPAIGKNVIKHQGKNSLNPLYIGTSLGVYYRDDSMSQWEPFDTNLPNVSVADLEINLEDSVLIAGTYGRGVWQCAIQSETPTTDVKLVAIQSPNVNISCGNSVSPQITIKNSGLSTITAVNVTYDYNGTPQNYTWNGSLASLASQNITLPSFVVATKGSYTLNVSTTVTSDANSENNNGLTVFYINDAGTLGTLNTFETASSELLTDPSTSGPCGVVAPLWKRAVNTNGVLATPGNNVYTTNITGTYPDKTKASLYSQCYSLTNAVNPMIKFKMGFALEQNWDVVYVQYSTNMGQNWSVLGTMGANWYNSNRTNASSGAANDCQNCPGAQWTGGSGAAGTGTGAVPALTDYFYSLNSLIGQPNVIFRIVFESDDSTADLGVTIDNFIIDGTLSNQDFELKNIAIYPNPSTGLFTVSTGNKAIDKVEVYDVAGKVVLSANNFSNANSQTMLDM